MLDAGYKDGQWYDVGFWRVNLNNPNEEISPVFPIGEMEKSKTFKNAVASGEQFLKLD